MAVGAVITTGAITTDGTSITTGTADGMGEIDGATTHHDYDDNWYGPYGYGRWDGYWYRHHRYPAVYPGYPGGLVCDYDGDDCRPVAPLAVPFSSVYPY